MLVRQQKSSPTGREKQEDRYHFINFLLAIFPLILQEWKRNVFQSAVSNFSKKRNRSLLHSLWPRNINVIMIHKRSQLFD